MNLYLLEQTDNNDYDTYDNMIVCAESEQDARTIHPDGSTFVENTMRSSWAKLSENITCKLIGIAIEGATRGVELASFNAG